MAEFKELKIAVQKQFAIISKENLFVVNIIDKDLMWNTYLNSFPPGVNKKYIERNEYDCNCCRQFIKAVGAIVAIINNKLVSIWDISNLSADFQPVADAMSALIKSKMIDNEFRYFQKHAGTDFNIQELENGKEIRWEHFFVNIPKRFVSSQILIGSYLSGRKTSKRLFKRGLDEITEFSLSMVIELIEQNSLYRGAEKLKMVKAFFECKKEYDKIIDYKEKDNYCWLKSSDPKTPSRLRNDVIGTLLQDISSGLGIDDSVNKYEQKVSSGTYQRSTAVATKGMREKSLKEIREAGLESALDRRFAVAEDLTINNVLFADEQAQKEMSVLDEFVEEAPKKIQKFDKVEEVNIQDFIDKILPKVDSIELMFENKHRNNLMSLIAPQDATANRLFKWNNNFSHSYIGNFTDVMKENVKKAGGNVDGVLRFSIQWNDEDTKGRSDFDAHSYEPPGHAHIYFSNQKHVHRSSGVLDIDITNPGNEVALENIIYTNIYKMPIGKYIFKVHCYAKRTGMGWKAQIEFDGQIHHFHYNKAMRHNEYVEVGVVELTKDGKFKLIKSLNSKDVAIASNEIWGIKTNNFHRVSMILNSPNHWDGNEIGNKHYFFILENCKNDEEARGFYNEFLRNELKEHRKSFEMLAEKMKVPMSDNQLSGLGFSSTLRNEIICKVTGSFTRVIKIKF